MCRQIFHASFVVIILTFYWPRFAGGQSLISPNRILSYQTNIGEGKVSFATSLAMPIQAPVIYYRQTANGQTMMLADFAYIIYPFPHEILTIDNSGSPSTNGTEPGQQENSWRCEGQVDRIGFEQLHTTPPIFRITAEAKDRRVLNNIAFQADYGCLTVSWNRQGEASKTENVQQNTALSNKEQTKSLTLTPAEIQPEKEKIALQPATAESCHLLFTTTSLAPDRQLTGLTVVLDPGHGGSDPGAQRQGIQEKEITLAIVNNLKKALEGKGIKVLLTRSDDNFVSLEDRVKLANAVSPDLFLSVHINALENDSEIHGVETYYKTPQSKALAEAIHDSLVGYLGIPDRLVRKARFYVINHTAVPAVLAEVGFISSTEERQRLISSDYQDRVATALEHGVILYLAKAKELAQQIEGSQNTNDWSRPNSGYAEK